MSDSTNQGGSGGDFRGSREEKRQDETVMINSDNLSDMVSEAKTADAPAAAPASSAASKPLGTSTDEGGPNMLIIGIGVALILIVVIALVFQYMGD